MRLGEYIVFLIIFTICYILFFVIYDKIKSKKAKDLYESKIRAIITKDKYDKFSNFYGIQPNNFNYVINAYYEIKDSTDLKLSYLAGKYRLPINDVVVMILFFEYNGLLPKKCINVQSDSMIGIMPKDLSLVNKYSTAFNNKMDLEDIITNYGPSCVGDLIYIDNNYLVPGVRLINDKIYYIGDNNE